MEIERIKEIQERYDKSTPRTWAYGIPNAVATEDQGCILIGPNYYQDANKGIRFSLNDAAFIACSHEDIPYLLKEIADLRATLAGFQSMMKIEGGNKE